MNHLSQSKKMVSDVLDFWVWAPAFDIILIYRRLALDPSFSFNNSKAKIRRRNFKLYLRWIPEHSGY